MTEFQSTKHDLPPDRVRLNLQNPRSVQALYVLAASYEEEDPEFATQLVDRLRELHGPPEDQAGFAYTYGVMLSEGRMLKAEFIEPVYRLLAILSGVAVERGVLSPPDVLSPPGVLSPDACPHCHHAAHAGQCPFRPGFAGCACTGAKPV